jgi:hypothetical protein
MFFLSKSKILSGLQCLKRLYLEVHQPELAEDSDEQQKAFTFGNQVGEVARQVHSGGRLIEYEDGPGPGPGRNPPLLSQPLPPIIYEATFSHGGVLVQSDIFHASSAG